MKITGESQIPGLTCGGVLRAWRDSNPRPAA
jgi:hypothetical protein